MSKVREISVDEAKNFKVARWINGRSEFITSIGYLEESTTVSVYLRVRDFLFGLPCGYRHITAIELNLETQKNWVMSVYGRAVLEQCTTLARELAEEFNVHVHVKLVREQMGKVDYYYA